MGLLACLIIASAVFSSVMGNSRSRRDLTSDLLTIGIRAARDSMNQAQYPYGPGPGFSRADMYSSPYQQLGGGYSGQGQPVAGLRSLLLARDSPVNNDHEYVYFVQGPQSASAAGISMQPFSDPLENAMMNARNGPRMHMPSMYSQNRRALLSLLGLLSPSSSGNMRIVLLPTDLDNEGPPVDSPKNFPPSDSTQGHPGPDSAQGRRGDGPADPMLMAARQDDVPPSVQRNSPSAPFPPQDTRNQPTAPEPSDTWNQRDPPAIPNDPQEFSSRNTGPYPTSMAQPGRMTDSNPAPNMLYNQAPSSGFPAQWQGLSSAQLPPAANQPRPIDSITPLSQPAMRPGDQSQTPTMYGVNSPGSANQQPSLNNVNANRQDIPSFSVQYPGQAYRREEPEIAYSAGLAGPPAAAFWL